MSMVEIEETELANLRGVWQIAEAVGKHPQARLMQQEAVATALPDRAGPEYRIYKTVDEKFAKLDEKLSGFLDGQKKAAEEAAAATNLAKLQNQWNETKAQARNAGYTDEGLKALEDWMEKKGVADHTIAIPAFERENPPPEPLMTGGSKWNFFDKPPQGDDLLKPLFDGNDDLFLGPTIQDTLRQVRGR